MNARRTTPSPTTTHRPRLPRVARIAVAVSTFAGASLALAAPALGIGEHGDPAGRMSAPITVLIFLGIPLGAAAVITFLVYLPSMISGPRYRPGRPWTAGPLWIGGPGLGGPADIATALASVTSLPAATIDGGGASARW